LNIEEISYRTHTAVRFSLGFRRRLVSISECCPLLMGTDGALTPAREDLAPANLLA